MFRCRVCISKDALITSLQEQVAYLKSMLSPMEDVHNPNLVNREANAVLSGDTQMRMVDKLYAKELKDMHPDEAGSEEIIAERDKILSGNY